MFLKILFIVLLLLFQPSFNFFLYSQEDDELIEVDLGEEETEEESIKEESLDEEIEKEEEKSPVKKETLKEIKPGIFFSKFDFQFYGSFFYTFIVNQIKATNSSEYNHYQIDNIKTDTIIGLRFFNKSDISGFVEFDFNSDNSLYDFNFYRFSLDLDRKFIKLKLFYRDWFYDFDDGLRLLDNEYYSFNRPVIFYKKLIDKYALFGRDYYGLYFEYDHYIKNRLVITAPYCGSQDKEFMVTDQFSFPVYIINLNANVVYKDQDYDLPSVNQDNWAEYNGIWYEFNTNTFFNPKENDFQIKATAEINANIEDKLTLWAEAGIDNKYGGYYAETSMTASDSGNIPYLMTLNSDNFKSFIMGAGLQVDLDIILFEGDYKNYIYKYNTFSFTSNVLISERESKHNVISVRGKVQIGIISSVNEFSILTVQDGYITVPYEEYNLKNVSASFVTALQKIRSFNEIILGDFKLYPEVEYRDYTYVGDIKEINIEVNQGVSFDITEKLGLFVNVRYKRYDLSRQDGSYEQHSYIYYFSDITYYFTENIYIGLSYGLDPRLVHEYEYGFEYILNEDINQENNLSKNNFIVLRGMLKF